MSISAFWLRYTDYMHHAFVIEGGEEEGIEAALAWVKENLKIEARANPDVITLRYGLLSVEDARKVGEVASQAPFTGDKKVVIIAAGRAYHEAQNALLKVFEEPPQGTYLFLILPSLGNLLPTLRSRVVVLARSVKHRVFDTSGVVEEFAKASKEKRSAIIKRLTSGKDEDERRENREEAIALLNGIESIAAGDVQKHAELLNDISILRKHLYDRSAPVKMILEHISLVIPKHLL